MFAATGVSCTPLSYVGDQWRRSGVLGLTFFSGKLVDTVVDGLRDAISPAQGCHSVATPFLEAFKLGAVNEGQSSLTCFEFLTLQLKCCRRVLVSSSSDPH